MNRLRIPLKKSLGQHFLIDKNIARKIVRAISPQSGQTIVEIGPGNGALTEFLLESDARIIAIDIDQRFIDSLQNRFSEFDKGKLILNCADILDINFSMLPISGTARIGGNLPYNITSQILFHLIDERAYISDIIVMVQREVAHRIAATPKSKEYGILSVLLQLHANVKILFHVSPNVFFPKPMVESSVLSIIFTEDRVKKIINYPFFKRIVKETFNKRRKKILNGLKSMNLPIEKLPIELSVYYDKRPEELSLDDFITVSNTIFQSLNT